MLGFVVHIVAEGSLSIVSTVESGQFQFSARLVTRLHGTIITQFSLKLEQITEWSLRYYVMEAHLMRFGIATHGAPANLRGFTI